MPKQKPHILLLSVGLVLLFGFTACVMAKTYIAHNIGVDPDKIFCVSIMPCVSKKFECDVEQINDAGHGKDVDVVFTTREL